MAPAAIFAPGTDSIRWTPSHMAKVCSPWQRWPKVFRQLARSDRQSPNLRRQTQLLLLGKKPPHLFTNSKKAWKRSSLSCLANSLIFHKHISQPILCVSRIHWNLRLSWMTRDPSNCAICKEHVGHSGASKERTPATRYIPTSIFTLHCSWILSPLQFAYELLMISRATASRNLSAI